MKGIKKRNLQFIAVSLMPSSLVTFVPLLGQQPMAALAKNTPTMLASPTMNDNKSVTTDVVLSTVHEQPVKRYFVYQMKDNKQILLNSFQNLNDAILLAKEKLNAEVMDEVSHTVLWKDTLPSGSVPKAFVQPPKLGTNPTFDDALAFVLDWEGGYSNNPNDHGGSTYKGITQSEYSSYRIAKGLAEQFRVYSPWTNSSSTETISRFGG
jgi:hypothetical protein